MATIPHRMIQVAVPEQLTKNQRAIIGEAIVEFMRKRTESGKDKRNNDFVKLTKDYADYKSTIGAGDQADLTLTGDMLISLDVLTNAAGLLEIGFEKDSEENAKADGHISGYVRRNIDKKKRDFLGIYKKEVTAIIKALKADGSI